MLRRLWGPALSAFLLCTPALAQDADLDGVPNGSDAFPCDPSVTAQLFAPAQDTHGMLLVEDQWPALGDLDTNDLVATYNYAFELDEMGRTHRLRLTLNVLAIGGIFDNGVGLHLPVAQTAVGAVSMTVDGGAPVALTPSATDAELTVVLQQNLRALFGNAAGQINSRTDLPRQPGAMIVVTVELTSPSTLVASEAPYDLFLFRTADPTHEIHQTRYSGTSNMNAGLFGTQDDGSVPGRRFVDSQGLPAFILLPESTPYPKEAQPISSLFPDIIAFAASGGTTNTDFFVSQVVSSPQFVDVNGLGAPTPNLPTVTIDTTCVSQADSDGDGFIAANDCDDLNAQVFPGNPEICDGLDNDCNQLIDDGVSGNFATFYQDADGDGFGDANQTVSACAPPPGYVAGGALCTNGSSVDCNAAGTTLIPSSAFVDPAPPSGWQQCAGFVNTTGNDVGGTFMDNCLNSTSLRVVVTNQATGQVEEDVYSTNLNAYASWPSWNYLQGSLTALARTYWGTTTFFTTTDGRDACGHSVGVSGQPTFGSGNGSRAIIVGGDSGANEYRVNCSGASLTGRTVAVYTLTNNPVLAFDCDDSDGAINPGASEVCNGLDDNCDSNIDENNPGGGVSCSTGLGSTCDPGLLQCTSGSLVCQSTGATGPEICADGTDNNCDGQVDEPICSTVTCSNGSGADCNAPGTSLIPSSVYVDYNPPAGWTQCAGFLNTTGDDVGGNFMSNCLNSTRLRVIVTNASTGQVEEDVFSTSLNAYSSWPSWNYLGGTLTAATRTYWGTTTYFTTTDGRDACGRSVVASGQPTFGSGNGSRAIIVGGDTGANEYRVNCSGQSLTNRYVAVYR